MSLTTTTNLEHTIMADSKKDDPTITGGSKVSDASDSGQPGKIVDLKNDEKPDPTTIAQAQIVD